MSAWQPISTAPKNVDIVMGYSALVHFIMYWAADSKCWRSQGEGRRMKPTHWMPLPAPPSSPHADTGRGE